MLITPISNVNYTSKSSTKNSSEKPEVSFGISAKPLIQKVSKKRKLLPTKDEIRFFLQELVAKVKGYKIERDSNGKPYNRVYARQDGTIIEQLNENGEVFCTRYLDSTGELSHELGVSREFKKHL